MEQCFRSVHKNLPILLLIAILPCSPFPTSQQFSDWPVPKYTVNLNEPPEERWIPVLRDHGGDYVKLISDIFRHLVPPPLARATEILSGALDVFLNEETAAEIKGIAKYLNLTLGDVVLPNIMYDITAFNRKLLGGGRLCTSIVAQDSEGHIWHGRNLDYGADENYTQLLKQVTIQVDFMRDGKVQYTTTTFLGLVGAMTGQKPSKFTVSLDERNTGYILENIAELLEGKATLWSHLVRETLEEADGFESAVQKLANTRAAAPTYLIVGGTKPGEGVVITRDRTKAKDIWRLDAKQHRWFLVETNYDHWEPPPPGDDRRNPAIRAMNGVGQAAVNGSSLFKVLSVEPVLNRGTTYTSIMSAADPQLYYSTIRKLPTQ